ncbi:MAG: hypothetical protein U0N10_06725 [Bacilli bacterium]
MDTAYIFGILSIIVTFICGIIAKRIPWFNNNLIPIQNLLIGLLAALIHYLITKDFSLALILSGVTAGGTYDILHNMNKIEWAKLLDLIKFN